MKSSFAVLLAFILTTAVGAQGLRPAAVKGAVLGGVAGTVIGHNSGDLRHNAWRGAAIGAGAGLVVGSMIGDRSDHRYRGDARYPASFHYSYIHRSPHRHYGHGGFRRHSGWRHHGYYSRPSYVYLDRDFYGYDYGYTGYDGYSYNYGRPSYAANGVFLGALAGAVIGNNSGDLRHNSWRGAAYGAAAGYVLGSIAENNARRKEAAAETPNSPDVSYDQEERARALPATQAPATRALSASPVTALKARPSSSMSSANSLFGR